MKSSSNILIIAPYLFSVVKTCHGHICIYLSQLKWDETVGKGQKSLEIKVPKRIDELKHP